MRSQMVYCPKCRDRVLADVVARHQDGYVQTRCGRGHKIRAKDKRAEARIKVQARVERLGTVPRGQSGRVLRVSADTKAAWREVRRAKRRDSFVRRGQAWLDLLVRDAMDAGPDDWTERWSAGDFGVEIMRHRAETRSTPTLSFRKQASLGLWSRGFQSGHSITITERFATSLYDARETLLHEALHELDSIAEIADDRGHDRLWAKRLAALTATFTPAGLR